MFETVDRAEVTIPDELKDSDERAWWYVSSRIHNYWFHVTCEFNYGDDEEDVQMLFLTQIDHLMELNNAHYTKILQVEIVTPGHMNGSDRWKMEPLSEIWSGIEPDTPNDQDAYIFILENGGRYVYSGLDTKEQELLNKKINIIFT